MVAEPARRGRRDPRQGEPRRVRVRLRLGVLVVPARRHVAPSSPAPSHQPRRPAARAAAPARRSRRTSPASASAPTRVARSASRRRTTSSSASVPPWASPAATASSRSRSARTPVDRSPAASPTPPWPSTRSRASTPPTRSPPSSPAWCPSRTRAPSTPTALAGTRIGYVTSMIGTNPTNVRLWAAGQGHARGAGRNGRRVAAAAGLVTRRARRGQRQHEQVQARPGRVRREPPGAERDGPLAAGQSWHPGKFVPSRQSTYRSRDAITEATYQGWAGPTGTHTTSIANGHDTVTAMMDCPRPRLARLPVGHALRHPRRTCASARTRACRPSRSDGPGDRGRRHRHAGAGVNLEFLGRDYAEGTLIGLAYAFEQATAGTPAGRTSPSLYGPLPAG